MGTTGSIALALGAFSSEREQLLVGIAGTVISLGFSLYSELRQRTKVKAAIMLHDNGDPAGIASLQRLVQRN